METQVTTRIVWLTLTNEYGESSCIPEDDYIAADWPDHHIEDRMSGYGVRESAPGYLDCTEWEVFETLAEAKKRAVEIDAEYDDMESA